MPPTHWFLSRGPEPISLVFRRSLSLNLQWPSKTFIHPPGMTMTDIATKRSICIFSLFPSSFLFRVSFFPPFSSLPLGPLPLHSFAVLLMCRIWWKSESADCFDTVACESNNAIAVWPWRATNSCVHPSGFLTRVTFHLGQSLQIIHANFVIILYLQDSILQAVWSQPCWAVDKE